MLVLVRDRSPNRWQRKGPEVRRSQRQPQARTEHPRYKEIPVSHATAAQQTNPAPTTSPMTEAERDLTALAEAVGVLRIASAHAEG